MELKNWYLQLFAENTSGETAAAAGQQPAGGNPERAEKGQDAAAENKRLTWEQIMADPEYNRQMQAIIRSRLKSAGSSKASPARGGGAAQAVTEGVESPSRLAATAPFTRGPLEPAQHKGFAWQQEQHVQQHFGTLRAQAESLQAAFPEFSLENALRDPKFLQLTAPHVGLSVENAWYLLNREKIQAAAMQLAAKRTAEKLSSAIASGGHRPVENGTAARAPSVSHFNAVSSREQRDALKKAIYRSASRGEKLYPND